MQFKSALIAASAIAGVALAQTNSFSVASPSGLVQCQPYQILITGGTPPFNIRVTKPGDVNSIIENLPQTSDRTVSWVVNVPAGTAITLVVVDSTGANAPSAPSPNINTSNDSSCLNKSASISSASGSGNTGGSASSTTGGSSSASSSSGSRTTGTTSAPASTTSAASGGNNGAAQLSGYSAAIAGAVGVVVAALF